MKLSDISIGATLRYLGQRSKRGLRLHISFPVPCTVEGFTPTGRVRILVGGGRKTVTVGDLEKIDGP